MQVITDYRYFRELVLDRRSSIFLNRATMKNQNSCHYCEGLGYIEIRDCSGEIQREETCSFCGGLGYIQSVTADRASVISYLKENSIK